MAATVTSLRSVLPTSHHIDSTLPTLIPSSTMEERDNGDDGDEATLPSSTVQSNNTNATNRSRLLSAYYALEPSSALLDAANAERRAAQTASNLTHRINMSRRLALDETASEKLALDQVVEKLSSRLCAPSPGNDNPALHRVEHLDRQQRAILSKLYPCHPSLDVDGHAILNQRRRIALLKDAFKDQNVALTKLTDAANLLLLVADHVQILASYYAQPNFSNCSSSSTSSSGCPFPNSSSSSTSFPSSPSSSVSCSRESSLDCSSSDSDSVRVGCLGRSDDSRVAPFYVSTVPSSYRFRYLRKCWGYAADALVAAVDASSFLYRHVERLGQRELIPGLESQCKRCLWLVELPGGVTVFFRADFLLKMESDARSMRTDVLAWHYKVEQFANKIGKELALMRKKESILDDRLFEARKRLLERESMVSRVVHNKHSTRKEGEQERD